jgi:uncharacterized protein
MQSPAKPLYELQEIDLTIQKHQQRLQTIVRVLADNEAIQVAQVAVNEAEEILKPLESDMRDLEHQVESTRQKREQSETRLYSGSVSNPKELQDIEQNIASLKRRQNELEDRLLEFMLEVEAAQENVNQAQQTLQEVIQKSESENIDLLSEKDKLQSELKQLATERQKAAQALSDEHLTLYETMKTKKANRPIAELSEEKFCLVCGVQQRSMIAQAVRRGDNLVRCENCERILVYI